MNGCIHTTGASRIVELLFGDLPSRTFFTSSPLSITPNRQHALLPHPCPSLQHRDTMASAAHVAHAPKVRGELTRTCQSRHQPLLSSHPALAHTYHPVRPRPRDRPPGWRDQVHLHLWPQPQSALLRWFVVRRQVQATWLTLNTSQARTRAPASLPSHGRSPRSPRRPTTSALASRARTSRSVMVRECSSFHHHHHRELTQHQARIPRHSPWHLFENVCVKIAPTTPPASSARSAATTPPKHRTKRQYPHTLANASTKHGT